MSDTAQPQAAAKFRLWGEELDLAFLLVFAVFPSKDCRGLVWYHHPRGRIEWFCDPQVDAGPFMHGEREVPGGPSPNHLRRVQEPPVGGA